MKTRSLIFGVAIFALSSACMKKACSKGVKATMKDLIGLDGCGYVLELEDGTRLEPMNLGTFDFQPKDGQKLRVTYEIVDDYYSNCMVGPGVEITCLTEW